MGLTGTLSGMTDGAVAFLGLQVIALKAFSSCSTRPPWPRFERVVRFGGAFSKNEIISDEYQ